MPGIWGKTVEYEVTIKAMNVTTEIALRFANASSLQVDSAGNHLIPAARKITTYSCPKFPSIFDNQPVSIQ